MLVDFEPSRGSEANKRRPAIVVSNENTNGVVSRLGRGVITVVPLTRNVERVFPFQVLIDPGETGLRTRSKAQAEQLRSVSFERLGPTIGRVSETDLHKVEAALRFHLQL